MSFRRITLFACALAQAGCSIVQPIAPSRSDSFFRTAVRTDAKPERCPPDAAVSDDCLQPVVKLDAFAGELGHAIWETDLRRRELAALGAERSNITSAYNALLWPIGAFIVAKNLRDPSASLLRDAGALAVASYGFLSAGIPDRDKLYLEASRRLACAIALSSAELYALNDIELTEDKTTVRRPLPPHMDNLAQTLLQFEAAIDTYQAERSAMLVELETLKPGTDRRTAVERRADEVAGRSAGGGAPRGAIKALSDHSRKVGADADRLFASLSELHDTVHKSGDALRLRRMQVNDKLTQALNSKTPTLDDPSAVFARIGERLAGVEKSLARPVAPPVAKAEGAAVAWEPIEDALAGLTKDSRIRVKAFEKGPATELARSVRAAAAWVASHEKRLTKTRAEAARSGCSESLFQDAADKPAPPATTPAPPAPGSAVRPLETP